MFVDTKEAISALPIAKSDLKVEPELQHKPGPVETALVAALELIKEKDNWTFGAFHRRVPFQKLVLSVIPQSPFDDDAISATTASSREYRDQFCSVGAVRQVVYGGQPDHALIETTEADAIEYLSKAAHNRFGLANPVYVNDTHGHLAAITMFNLAIKMARAKGA